MGNGGGRGGWGAPAEGGGGPGGGGGGGGPPPMFIGGGMTGGATESTAGWPWKGEPGEFETSEDGGQFGQHICSYNCRSNFIVDLFS